MRKAMLLTLFLLGAGLFPSAASADVKVNFIEPQRYYDASLYGGYGARRYTRTTQELEKFFQELNTRYLGPGDQLTIEVLNIDLAGEYEPWSLNTLDVRFMRDITWPRIRMRYVLTRADAAPISGEEMVSDPNYLSYPNFKSGSGVLAYEKVMLERWFKARFAAPKPAAPG